MDTRKLITIHRYATLGYDQESIARKAGVSRRTVTRTIGTVADRRAVHRCGAVIDNISRYCHYCGTHIDKEQL